MSSSHQCKLMVFYWSLSVSKSLHVSRTPLSILTNLSNASVGIDLISPYHFSFFSSLRDLFFASHQFLQSLSTSYYKYFLALCGPRKQINKPDDEFIIYSLSFSHQFLLMFFHWRLSDSKSTQVSRTLLSIQAVLNSSVVWMVSTRPLTAKSPSSFQ